MSSTSSDTYGIARNSREQDRLDEQHRIYMQCQGYHLHPTIDVGSKDRIADVATGTAIFLRDLAHQLPEAEHHGFDISESMYPSNQNLGNIRLHIHDAKQRFPLQWRSYFDVVHIRFLQAGLPDADAWIAVLRNSLELLKPGGYIQWTENDTAWSTRYAVRGPPPTNTSETDVAFIPPSTSAFRRSWQACFPTQERVDGMLYGFRHLERLFKDPDVGNLDDVTVDAYGTDAFPHLRKQFTIMGVTAGMSILNGLFGTYLPGEERLRLQDLEDHLMHEIEQGVYIRMQCCTFIGRKKM